MVYNSILFQLSWKHFQRKCIACHYCYEALLLLLVNGCGCWMDVVAEWKWLRLCHQPKNVIDDRIKIINEGEDQKFIKIHNVTRFGDHFQVCQMRNVIKWRKINLCFWLHSVCFSCGALHSRPNLSHTKEFLKCVSVCLPYSHGDCHTITKGNPVSSNAWLHSAW